MTLVVALRHNWMDRLRLSACVALMVLATAASAQGPQFQFSRYDVTDGLPAALVLAVAQDRQGFVWVGTEAGLARTDGVATTVFRSNADQPGALPHDRVTALLVDRGGQLWVGTPEGLARFDPATETFTTVLTGHVRALFQERAGALWIGTREGAVRVVAGRGRRYRHSQAERANERRDWVLAFAEDARGEIWVGTTLGLSRLDRTTGRLVAVPLETATGERLRSSAVTSLVADSGGLWVGGLSRLLRLDPATRTVRIVPLNDLWPTKTVGDINVWALHKTPEALWVGSGRGVVRIDRQTGGRTLQHAPSAPGAGLLNGEVQALTVDRQGVLWVGTRNGVARADVFRGDLPHVAPSPDGLDSPMVFALLQDRRGDVWVGTGGGLFRHDRRRGTFTHYPSQPGSRSGLGTGGIRSLMESADGTIWIGTIGGVLNRLDPVTGAVQRYTDDATYPDPYDPQSGFRVRALLQDDRGTVWAGSQYGLYRIDPGETTPRRVARMNQNDEGNEVWALVQDPEGVLWAGTETGLLRYDPRSGQTRRFRHVEGDRGSVPDESLYSLYLDAEGALWIGSMRHGLSRFDRRTGRVTQSYTAGASGLSDDRVYQIQPGTPGELWMSTNLGLARLAVDSGTFTTYGVERGAQSTEFNAGASFRGAGGELFFGGINGYNAFFPDRIRDNPTPPQVALTGLRVMNRPVGPSPDGPIQAAMEVAREVVVPHDENFLTFEFAGLHAALPGALTYAYRLDGLDAEWQRAGTQRTATYTDLNPGKYTFRVRSRSAAGVWSREEAKVRVRVVPFWYETVWARSLAALVLIGGLGLAVVGRLRRADRRERELEATVRERTLQLQEQAVTLRTQADELVALDVAKSRFLANVSHEFRTPLTLTLGPLEDLRAGAYGPQSAGAVRQLDLALRNGRRLLRLVGQLLDVARIEAGAVRLDLQRGDLGAYVRTLAQPFVAAAERNRVGFAVEIPQAPVWVRMDADQLDKVVANLLSNALKFTPAGGAITLTVSRDGADALVAVRDTGSGIAPEIRAHLFERFFQGEKSEMQPGTGIGLALAKDLAELHGGTLDVESEVGGPDGGPTGSVFTLRMPLADPSGDGAAGGGEAAEATLVVAATTVPPLRPDAPLETDPESLSEPPDDDRTTVLVVDDNADIRAYLRGHLERDDQYRVVEAADGEAALEAVRRRLPDLVVSDVMMPRLDGFGLLEAIRSDPETDFVPVVLLTARAEAEDRLAGLGLGADDYVTKPFDAHELTQRVDNLIAMRRRLRERYAVPPAPTEAVASDPRLGQADQAFLDAVEAAVEARLADETFDVAALAEAVAQSRSTLHRRLSDLSGESPSAYLRRRRLERGADLLRQRAGTVSEVAYAVGFKSVSHFSSSFSRHYNLTPTAWMEEHAAPALNGGTDGVGATRAAE